jgi:hypothetical protein
MATTTTTDNVTARNVLDALVAGGLTLDNTVQVIDISESVTAAGTSDPTDLRIEIFETVADAIAERTRVIDAAGGQGVAILHCGTIVVSVVAGVSAETTETAVRIADVIRPTLEASYGPC